MNDDDPKVVAIRFYEGFQARDAGRMAACYHEKIVFSDPIFPRLMGKEVTDMWKMLCSRSADLRIDFRVMEVADSSVTVIWNAWYTFTKTGRPVHNVVHSRLTLKDGKIIDHVDTFSFWRWSSQALGTIGYAFGWTPFLRKVTRRNALKALRTFQHRTAV